MFAEKKLVILKNLFANKKFQEEFAKDLKDLESTKDIIIIYEEDKVDERLKIFKDLKKSFDSAQDRSVKCQEFEFLDGLNLKKWLSVELAKSNAKIEPMAENLLLNFVGNDLWQLRNEVIKLSSFKAGKVVTAEDVKLLVKPKIDSDIFRTIEALAQKNKKLALSLIYKHIENGDHPLYLLSMIAYQFRTLLILKESGGKKTGLHPFVVQKTLPLCNKFTFAELKNIYQKIFEIDIDIKTGKIDAELAIDMLVAQI
jgi:DNA polymerase-3 subunit delta